MNQTFSIINLLIICLFVFVACYSIISQGKNNPAFSISTKIHNGFFNPSGVDESQKLDSDTALDAQLIDD